MNQLPQIPKLIINNKPYELFFNENEIKISDISDDLFYFHNWMQSIRTSGKESMKTLLAYDDNNEYIFKNCFITLIEYTDYINKIPSKINVNIIFDYYTIKEIS